MRVPENKVLREQGNCDTVIKYVKVCRFLILMEGQVGGTPGLSFFLWVHQKAKKYKKQDLLRTLEFSLFFFSSLLRQREMIPFPFFSSDKGRETALSL